MALSLAQITLRETELPQHCMQQAGPDLLPSVFDHGEPLSDIDGGVASLAALNIDADSETPCLADPIEPPE
jgi:hypothetical protein